ncbi:hypothetical protein GOD95_05075 [Paeniclostridium sordellii]|uniref:hypothetical protein n=1 Tax=Paraclostridium sordellii TaxID=1505 RepID=UPI0012EE7E4E|nr:hypothetical protein [Paeniclostridium sordellii]MVO70815.1 hypothetical protein [Paeniclostridium sordellii]
MKISDEKRKKLYNLIDILEVKTDFDLYYKADIELKNIKGLSIIFDLSIFKKLSIYIPNMILIDEYLIKDYIIENLESICK